jgi:transposase-like protein
MKKTRDGKRRFSPEFKIAAVRRVNEGESPHAVARDLDVNAPLLWKWRKQVTQEGESALKGIGRPKGSKVSREATEGSYQRRIAELERLVGRQQMEMRFLDSALRQVEELRREKNDDGAAASTKR